MTGWLRLVLAFCLLAAHSVLSSRSILEEYLDPGHSVTDEQVLQDAVRIRRVAGHLIRICDQELSDMKLEAVVAQLRSLGEIIFTPGRLQNLIHHCLLARASWELLENSKFFAALQNDFANPMMQMLFEEFMFPENFILRTHLEDFLEAVRLECSAWTLASGKDLLGIFFNKEHGVDLGFIPKAFSDSLKIFLVMYFNDIDFHIKKNLIAALIETPPGTSLVKAFFVALNECGPTLQKIFQLLMDEAANKELSEVHIALKTLCSPMNTEDMVKVLIQSFGNQETFDETFKYLHLEADASATVGEGHRALLRENDSLVFVKIKKYQIEHKMRLDFELMQQVAVKYPQYEGIYQELQTNMTAEMDWEREIQNMKDAAACYNQPEYGIYVPEIIACHPEKDPKVIIMEYIQGTTLIPFVPKSGQHLCTLVRLLSNFYKIWWNEAIYQSGFIHCDIHGGNLMYIFNEEEPDDSRLYVIDYGNTKILDHFTRQSVIEIALGVYLNDPVAVVNGLGRLRCPEQEALWNECIEKLTKYMNLPRIQRLNRDERITRILKYITGTFELPNAKDILIFFRAKGLFDGIFKYLENNYAASLNLYGCPIPRTNALAREVAFWNARNLLYSVNYGIRPIWNLIYNHLVYVPNLVWRLWKRDEGFNNKKECDDVMDEINSEPESEAVASSPTEPEANVVTLPTLTHIQDMLNGINESKEDANEHSSDSSEFQDEGGESQTEKDELHNDSDNRPSIDSELTLKEFSSDDDEAE